MYKNTKYVPIKTNDVILFILLKTYIEVIKKLFQDLDPQTFEKRN